VITWDETSLVLEYLLFLNPALKVVPGMVDAWHDALGDFTYDEVRLAAREVGRRQTWVGVADIYGQCKQARRDRIRAAGNIQALVTADRDDDAACHRQLQQLTHEIAAGIRNARGELVAPAQRRLEAS
jgi:hypothetical protein